MGEHLQFLPCFNKKKTFLFKSSSPFDMEAICVYCVPKIAGSEINYRRKVNFRLVVQCTMSALEKNFYFPNSKSESGKN